MANLNSPPLMPQWLHSSYFRFFLIDVLKHFEAFLVQSGDYSDCMDTTSAVKFENKKSHLLYVKIPYYFSWDINKTRGHESSERKVEEGNPCSYTFLSCSPKSRSEHRFSNYHSHVPDDAQTFVCRGRVGVCVFKCCNAARFPDPSDSSRGKTLCICFTSAALMSILRRRRRPRIVSPTSLSASLLCIY